MQTPGFPVHNLVTIKPTLSQLLFVEYGQTKYQIDTSLLLLVCGRRRNLISLQWRNSFSIKDEGGVSISGTGELFDVGERYKANTAVT